MPTSVKTVRRKLRKTAIPLGPYQFSIPQQEVDALCTQAVRDLNLQAVARLAVKMEESEVSSPNTHDQASYLSPILPRVNRDRTLAEAVKRLEGVDFDTIAVRGVSGLLIGPTLAFLMGKELVVSRKKNEKSTSYRDVEGHIDIRRYIIADDLVSTGSTAVRIMRHVAKISPGAELMGILTYGEDPPVCVNFADQNSGRTKGIVGHFKDPKFKFTR